MSLTITCSCGKKLKIPESKKGKALKCPSCGGRIQSTTSSPADLPRKERSRPSSTRTRREKEAKPPRSEVKKPKTGRTKSRRRPGEGEKVSRREKTQPRSEVTNRKATGRSRAVSRREKSTGASPAKSRRGSTEAGKTRGGGARSARSQALSGRSRGVLQAAEPTMGVLYTAALGGTTIQVLAFLALIGLTFSDPTVLAPAGFGVNPSNRIVLAGLFAVFALISVFSFLSLFTVWKSASGQLQEEARTSNRETEINEDLLEEPRTDESNNDEKSSLDEIDL